MAREPSLEKWCKENGKEELLKQWDRQGNPFTPADIYYHSRTQCRWICEKGHKWSAAPERRTKHKTTACPYCTGRLLTPSVNSLAALYPSQAAFFDSARNGITPDQIFPQTNRRYWWRCKAGHEWQATPNSFVNGRGECPYCAHRRASPEYNLESEFPLISSEWALEKNDGVPSDYLPHSEKAVWWRCHFHPDQVWRSPICYRTTSRTSNCPVCRKGQNISFPEQAVYYYLNMLFPDAENRSRVAGKEADIFLPTLKLVIEYDGYYYHKSDSALQREERKDREWLQRHIQVLRIKEYISETPPPASDDILWYPVPQDYSKYLFLEDLVQQLVALLNQRYTLRLTVRPDIRRDSQNIMSSYFSRRKETSLVAQAPDLAAQWHKTRNGSITPELVAATSNKMFWWMCEKGHEWQASPWKRVRGSNCPYCSGKKVSREKSLAAQKPELVKWWHPTKNGDLTPWHVMPYSVKTVWWKCPKDHEWQMKVADATQGSRCPYCSHHWVSEENALAVKRPDLAFEWNYARNPAELNPNTVSYSSSKKVWWICRKKHEWQEKVSNRSQLGLRCPYCSGRRATEEDNLAVLYPALIAEWHPTKNGNLVPQQFRPKSNRKVWWRCQRGHEWEAQICSRTTGTGCPYCAGKRVWEGNCLANTYPQIARYWHPKKNAPLTPRDVAPHSGKEVWWRCERGHEWKQKICYAIDTKNCPYCDGRLATRETSLAGARPDLALEWHPTKNLPLAAHDLTLKSKKKVWWKCQRGHEWQMDIRTRVSGIGNCPYCMGKRVCPENALATLSPKIAAQWHPAKNGSLTPEQVTNHSSAKAWWLCPKGHEWEAVIRSRTVSGAGCPICAGKKAAPDYNLATEFPAIAVDWDHRINKKPPEDFLPFSNKEVSWRCARCGKKWMARVIDRTKAGRGCPHCSRYPAKAP